MGLLNAGSCGWCLRWPSAASGAVHRQVGDERHGRRALGRAYTHGKLKAASGRLRGEPGRQFCMGVGRGFVGCRMWCRADDCVSR